VNTAWALGLIVGPALGGYLSQVPVQKEKKRQIKMSHLEFSLKMSHFLTSVSIFHSQLRNILAYFSRILSLAGKSSKCNTYCPLLRHYKLLGISDAH
jgi:hypothetical protein